MLGIFHSPPDIFSKGHFPECDVIKGGVGGCKYGLWGGGGENKDMKRVNSELSAYMNDLGLGKFLSFTLIYVPWFEENEQDIRMMRLEKLSL